MAFAGDEETDLKIILYLKDIVQKELKNVIRFVRTDLLALASAYFYNMSDK